MRVKSKIVDAFQIHDRWKEEVELVKKEMGNLLKLYTDVRIPAPQQAVDTLEEKKKSVKFQGQYNKSESKNQK